MNLPRAYEGTEPYIFISYAHKDSDTVLPIITALQERGFRVWYDAGIEAGTEWPEYIAEHLNSSGVVLALISNNALNSHNCRREINLAIDLRKDMLAVYLEEVKMSLGMKMQLGTLQAMYRERHSTMALFMEELCKCRLLQPCGVNSQVDNPNDSQQQVRDRYVAPQYDRYAQQCYEDGKAQLQIGNLTAAFEYFKKAATASHVEAQYELGRAYCKGRGTEENINEAVVWFEMAAMQSHAESEYMLGCIYEVDFRDDVTAVQWYKKAAGHGHMDAKINLAAHYSEGSGVKKDMQAAAELYRSAAEQGSPVAYALLGECYFFGNGVERSYQEAVKWFRMGAESGRADAQCRLGECLEFGYGIEKEPGQAAQWYQKAAVQDDPEGCYRLGRCYEFGIGMPQNEKVAGKWLSKATELWGNEKRLTWDESALATTDSAEECYDLALFLDSQKEYDDAIRLFYIAAKRGYTQAQVKLAVYYENGLSVDTNQSEAVKWYRAAAEQGFAEAQFHMGRCLDNGIGVEEDEEAAVIWYRKAAEQGYAEAQYNLGLSLSLGRDFLARKNQDTEHIKWYRKAAEQGYDKAQYEMGWLYEGGYGVLKSKIIAKKWYRKAAEQGHEKAKQRLKEMGG